MSDKVEPSLKGVEQITRTPAIEPQPKVKDKKKVAAGKKLSEYNKKAKEKQKLAETSPDVNESNGWLPETSLITIIAILGLGLTAVNLVLRYKSTKTVVETDHQIKTEPLTITEQTQSRCGME